MVDYSSLNDEDFELKDAFDHPLESFNSEQEKNQYEPTKYTIQNHSARYIHMITIMALYLNAKYSEPLSDVFPCKDQLQMFIDTPVFDLEEGK